MNGGMICGYMPEWFRESLASATPGELWIFLLASLVIATSGCAVAAHLRQVIPVSTLERTATRVSESIHPYSGKEPRKSRSQRSG